MKLFYKNLKLLIVFKTSLLTRKIRKYFILIKLQESSTWVLHIEFIITNICFFMMSLIKC